jgi:cytochrome c oxidase cbb3-type subunit III
MRFALFLLTATVLSLNVYGQNVSSFTIRPPGDPAAIARGKTSYGTNCAYCHAEDARGGENGGTNLLRSDFVMRDKFGEEIGRFLQAATANEHKFRFASTELADIAAFLHAFGMNSRDPGRMRPPTILVGDAKAGESYFKAKCASCHSVTGDLKGYSSKHDTVRARQERWIMPVVFSPRGAPASYQGKPITVTVTLPGGKKVEGKLGKIDDFVVTLTDASGALQSFDRDGAKPKVEVHNPMKAHQDLLPGYTDADIHNITAYLETLK